MSSSSGDIRPGLPGSGTSSLLPEGKLDPTKLQPPSTGFVDKIDPFKKGSLKRKQRKSQGSSRYRLTSEVELQQLPSLKGVSLHQMNSAMSVCSVDLLSLLFLTFQHFLSQTAVLCSSLHSSICIPRSSKKRERE